MNAALKKKLYSLIFIIVFIFLPLIPNSQTQAANPPSSRCSITLTGPYELNFAAAIIESDSSGIEVKITGLQKNGEIKVINVNDPYTDDPYKTATFNVTPNPDASASSNIPTGTLEAGQYKLVYDRFNLFGECTPNPNDTTFYVAFLDSSLGMFWITSPWPVTDTDKSISLFIGFPQDLPSAKVHPLFDKASATATKHGLALKETAGCFMLKSSKLAGPTRGETTSSANTVENGGMPPGWQGGGGANFISYNPSVCSYEDGGGDICNDPQPHIAYDDVSLGAALELLCVEAENWRQNMILAPRRQLKRSGIGGYVLEIRDICENMEGERKNCEDPFNAGETYSLNLYGVLDPPVLDTEKEGLITDVKEACDTTDDKIKKGRTADVDTCDVFRLGGAKDGIISFTVQRTKKPSGQFGDVPKIETPFGEIDVSPEEIASAALNFGLGIAGGLAFILMAFGAYRLIFSAGNPEAIQQGKEVITAAIVGLLVIIFSVFILRLFGIGILGLPISG